MSHVWIRPADHEDYAHAFAYVDGKILNDNWARIVSMVNGGLHSTNLAYTQTDQLDESSVSWDLGGDYALPAEGMFHTHDGYDSAKLGKESITLAHFGGVAPPGTPDPQSYGIMLSLNCRFNTVVHCGSAHFETVPPYSGNFTQSDYSGVNYRVIAVPFDTVMWGGTVAGYIPDRISGWGLGRVITSLRSSSFRNSTRSDMSDLWCSSFSYSQVTDSGILAIKDITIWVNNNSSTKVYYDVWVDWAVISVTR